MSALSTDQMGNTALLNDRKSAFTDTRRFRAEIHGVRGLAILGVVLFHVLGSGRVSGGIDAFLAITGFLAIPSLVRRATAGNGWINLAKRWAGIARRILIPMIPVLVFVGIVGTVLYPLDRLPSLWSQIQASLLGYQNWALIAQSMDYNAASSAVSPLQHLWSISVQLQFHLLAPVLVMAACYLFIRRSADPRPVLAVLLLIVAAFSLSYAITSQQTNQGLNYFSTWSRAWELCVAGAVALLIPFLKLPPWFRAILGWTGLAMLFSTGFVFNGAAQFPSVPALWPVGGLMLVLIAGHTNCRWGPDRIWTLAPVVFLANIAYSLYLWHWPILIFWYSAKGGAKLTGWEMLAVIAISLVVGWLGYQLFEKRAASLGFFTSGKLADWRTLAAAAVVLCLGATISPLLSARATTKLQTELMAAEQAVAQDSVITASVAQGDNPILMEDIVPAVDIARNDAQPVFEIEKPECYLNLSPNGPIEFCWAAPPTDGPTILFIGASHVNQWWGAVEPWATASGINMALTGRAGCLFMDVSSDPERFISADSPDEYTSVCAEWNALALDAVLELDPDLVVTLATRVRPDYEVLEPASVAAWKRLDQADIPVVAIRDNPFWTDNDDIENDALACIRNNPHDARLCSVPRVYETEFDGSLPDSVPSNVTYVDFSENMCPAPGPCMATDGNLLIYRDGHHLTNTFVMTLQEPLLTAISAAGGFETLVDKS